MRLNELLEESGIELDLDAGSELLDLRVSFKDEIDDVLEDIDPLIEYLGNADEDEIEKLSLFFEEYLLDVDLSELLKIYPEFDLEFLDFLELFDSTIDQFDDIFSQVGVGWVIEKIKLLGLYSFQEIHEFLDRIKLVSSVLDEDFEIKFNSIQTVFMSFDISVLGNYFSLNDEHVNYIKNLKGGAIITVLNFLRTTLVRNNVDINDLNFAIRKAIDLRLQTVSLFQDFVSNLMSSINNFRGSNPNVQASLYYILQNLSDLDLFEKTISRFPDRRSGLKYIYNDINEEGEVTYLKYKVEYIAWVIFPNLMNKFNVDSFNLDDLTALIVVLLSKFENNFNSRVRALQFFIEEYEGDDLLLFVLDFLEEQSVLPVINKDGKEFSSYSDLYKYMVEHYDSNHSLLLAFNEIIKAGLPYEWIFNYGDEAYIFDEMIISEFGEEQVGHFILLNQA